jgi:hypothetical protein
VGRSGQGVRGALEAQGVALGWYESPLQGFWGGGTIGVVFAFACWL